MAELSISTDEVVGIKKEIDSGAMDIVFQALQEDIYSEPIPSFIRETVCNGLDSYIERNIALKILNGEPQENYYRQATDEGGVLKDSSFDKDYYSPAHLSLESVVDVKYVEGVDRDSISISDKGVGLGGDRLRGFFSLGYSSKRNPQDVTGKFGSGAQAGLATGVEYFTMTTVYNGYKTSFMILKKDYEPITVEEPGSVVEVWNVTMANDSRAEKTIYWNPTTEKNGVTIHLEVKKHNKSAFIKAVERQFSYSVNTVRLTNPFQYTSGINTRFVGANILYDTDRLVIPETSVYSAPHIIVDGINYGLVNWKELELEERDGGIGIKVKANEVDITQNRESLKWTDKTKEVTLSAIKEAEEEASEYVTARMDTTSDNVFETIETLLSAGKSSSNVVATTFSEFLDIKSIVPVLELPNLNMSISPDVNFPFRMRMDVAAFRTIFRDFTAWKVISTATKGSTVEIRRERCSTFSDLAGLPIVFAEESSLSSRISGLLFDELKTESFVYLRPVESELSSPIVKKYMTKQVLKYADVLLDERDFGSHIGDKELGEDSESYKPSVESLASIRARNKEVLYYTYDIGADGYGKHTSFSPKRYKNTVKVKDIKDEFSFPIVYATQEHASLLELCAIVDDRLTMDTTHRFILISKDNIHHYKDYGVHVTEYLKSYNPKTKEIMIGEVFQNLNTSLKLQEVLEAGPEYLRENQEVLELCSTIDLKKLDRYGGLNVNGYGEAIVLNMVGDYYVDKPFYEEVSKYLGKLADIQNTISEGTDEEILGKSKALLGAEILSIRSYDQEFIENVKSEVKRLEQIAPILNNLNLGYEDEAIRKVLNRILNLL